MTERGKKEEVTYLIMRGQVDHSAPFGPPELDSIQCIGAIPKIQYQSGGTGTLEWLSPDMVLKSRPLDRLPKTPLANLNSSHFANPIDNSDFLFIGGEK